MLKNFHTVRKNLYRGAAPSLRDIITLKKNFSIGTIISLDQKSGEYIDPLCKKLNINHIIIPIDVSSKNSLKHLLKHNIYKLVDESIPTFIHCKRGKDRAGLFIALCRCLLDGWSCKKAIREAKGLGFGTGMSNAMEKFYIKLISRADVNSDTNAAYDIVTNVDSTDNLYRDYTMDTVERGSWGPYADESMREYPENFMESYYTDSPEETRENYGLKGINSEDVESNQIPMVGVYDQNTQVTNLVGPSLIGGGFV